MPNGRWRVHGGLSTGPRTPEGLARSRRSNWKHGYYSAKQPLFSEGWGAEHRSFEKTRPEREEPGPADLIKQGITGPAASPTTHELMVEGDLRAARLENGKKRRSRSNTRAPAFSTVMLHRKNTDPR
jgi:hypothetical protein